MHTDSVQLKIKLLANCDAVICQTLLFWIICTQLTLINRWIYHYIFWLCCLANIIYIGNFTLYFCLLRNADISCVGTNSSTPWLKDLLNSTALGCTSVIQYKLNKKVVTSGNCICNALSVKYSTMSSWMIEFSSMNSVYHVWMMNHNTKVCCNSSVKRLSIIVYSITLLKIRTVSHACRDF